MRKYSILLFVIFLVVLQFSCKLKEDELEIGIGHSKYMIDTYIECDSISILPFDNHLKINFLGNTLWACNKIDFVKFYPIAKANNDTSFNDIITPGCYASINDSLSQINIICDKDIDENHLAGTELNDIFMFKAFSVYNVIQRHYESRKADFIQIPASEVNFSNTRVIFRNCELVLTQLPEKHDTYTFDISIKLSKKTFTNKVEMKL